MKPTRMAALLVLTSTALGTAACRRGTGDERSHRGVRRSLFDTLCDGTRACDELYVWDQMLESDWSLVGLKDCVQHENASLFGSWPIGHVRSRRFKWQAKVHENAVFPSLGHLDVDFGCNQMTPQFYSPFVSIIDAPDNLDWARLEGDDVFIPFDGTAAIDHAFYATAVLDAQDGGASQRVAISVAEPPLVPPKLRGHLGPGDSFVWGDHRATLVRIVEPQDGDLGVIGWVEIRLSGGPAPGSGP